jgi:hypothetical protein
VAITKPSDEEDVFSEDNYISDSEMTDSDH